MSLEMSEVTIWQSITEVALEQAGLVSWEYLASYRDAALERAGRKVITIKVRFDLGPRPEAKEITRIETDLVAVLQSACPSAELTVR